MTCYCDTGNCQNNRCQANYCLYRNPIRLAVISTGYREGDPERADHLNEAQLHPGALRPLSGQHVFDRSQPVRTQVGVSVVSAIQFRTVNDVNYQVKVCNNGNFCNTDCPYSGGLSGGQTVTCTQCDAINTNDCSGTTCTGNYCLYGELRRSRLRRQT